ncbi:hypothetical protein DFP72DRAFT_894857 [Ephemerocybe angulata]|uniref:Uncharacterized protein n=1 Tax=Ephemerocybe angulata TaxID=980116 RepID=A0A8H6M648_9AGAR|nr:hypothetical protein DFP72DRAFT_894857 [Tulosesus angulatus]
MFLLRTCRFVALVAGLYNKATSAIVHHTQKTVAASDPSAPRAPTMSNHHSSPSANTQRENSQPKHHTQKPTPLPIKRERPLPIPPISFRDASRFVENMNSSRPSSVLLGELERPGPSKDARITSQKHEGTSRYNSSTAPRIDSPTRTYKPGEAPLPRGQKELPPPRPVQRSTYMSNPGERRENARAIHKRERLEKSSEARRDGFQESAPPAFPEEGRGRTG